MWNLFIFVERKLLISDIDFSDYSMYFEGQGCRKNIFYLSFYSIKKSNQHHVFPCWNLAIIVNSENPFSTLFLLIIKDSINKILENNHQVFRIQYSVFNWIQIAQWYKYLKYNFVDQNDAKSIIRSIQYVPKSKNTGKM